jgi:hypothetical protein
MTSRKSPPPGPPHPRMRALSKVEEFSRRFRSSLSARYDANLPCIFCRVNWGGDVDVDVVVVQEVKCELSGSGGDGDADAVPRESKLCEPVSNWLCGLQVACQRSVVSNVTNRVETEASMVARELKLGDLQLGEAGGVYQQAC